MIKSAFDMPNIDPKLLPSLLAGGAGALAGGTLTAMSPERQGESRGSRRWRILRNALLLGGAGAGGTALLQKGIERAVTQPLPANDQDPLMKKIHDLASGKWGVGGAAGAAGIGIGSQALKEERNFGNTLMSTINKQDFQQEVPKPAVERWVTDKIKDPKTKGVLGNPGSFDAVDKDWIRNSGVNLRRLENKVKPGSTTLLDRLKGDAKLLGARATGIHRPGGIGRRSALVAGIAAIPALAAYMTNQDDQ